MVNNSTNIDETSTDLSPQITEHKDIEHWFWLGRGTRMKWPLLKRCEM